MRSSIEGIFLESCACRVTKFSINPIQVVAEGIVLENYLIRNVVALGNFHCNVCPRKIKTLCRYSLNF